ncbi:unnamed protein product, partial [marine sediment metagenome]
MLIKQFVTGGDRNFGYLAADEVSGRALVVDPSFSPEMIVDYARGKGYEIVYIFVTHDHIDHTNGNHVIGQLTGKQPLLFGTMDPTTGIRGARGGYVLARSPAQIKLSEVIGALDGPILSVDCLDDPSACNRVSSCAVREVWEEARQAIDNVLEST